MRHLAFFTLCLLVFTMFTIEGQARIRKLVDEVEVTHVGGGETENLADGGEWIWRWSGEARHSKKELGDGALPMAVVIELDQPRFLSGVAVRNGFYNANTPEAQPAYDQFIKRFVVETSMDGESWSMAGEYFHKQDCVNELVRIFCCPRWGMYLKITVAEVHHEGFTAGFSVYEDDNPLYRGLEEEDFFDFKNGDRLTGVLANGALSFMSSYAKMTLPVEHVGTIILEGGNLDLETIVMANGDIFRGYILEEHLDIEAEGQALKVLKNKLHRIGMREDNEMENELDDEEATAYVRMKNGDKWHGFLRMPVLSVQTDYALVEAQEEGMQRLVITGDMKPVTTIWMENGDKIQGVLMQETLEMETIFGQGLSVYQDRIQSIQFMH